MPILKPGEILLNTYQVERLLGQGAFGEVHLARHLMLKVPRAIKVLHHDEPGLGSTAYANGRERFTMEAQMGAQLKNAHLVEVYDFQEDNGNLILVMEYCAGGNLAEYIASRKLAGNWMPVDEALRICADIAAGLELLHKAEIIHRDLKPTNILFDNLGRAKVADLGLAQTPGGSSNRENQASLAPAQPGTPAYMSPEQETSRAYLTPASDIYTLGLILFEMITGRNYKSLKPGTRLQDLSADAPGLVQELLEKMLAEVSRERLWDGGEVGKALIDLELRRKRDEKSRLAREKAQVEKTRGEGFMEQKQYPQAEQAYRKALEIDPQDANTWNNLGDTMWNQNRYVDAEQAYRKALEIDPKNAVYWNNLGASLNKQNRYVDAEQAYRKALEIDPKNAVYWYNLGASLNKQNRYVDAEQAYRKALEIDPQDANTWNNLGDTMWNQNRYVDAEQAYRKALEIDPKKAVYWNNLGASLHNQNRYVDAEQAHRKALEIDPNNANTLEYLKRFLNR